MIELPHLGLHFSDGLLLVDPASERPIDFETWIITDAAEERRREEALAALSALRAGWRPDDAILAGSPVLETWHVQQLQSGAACLWGYVYAHPRFPAGRLIRTSLVVAFEGRNLSWARSLSRYYRLGTHETKSPGALRHDS